MGNLEPPMEFDTVMAHAKTFALALLLIGGAQSAEAAVQAGSAVAVGSPRNNAVDAAALDPARLRKIVETLAHDSTAGRKTPSPELDKAARYIEGHFREVGALPLGDDGTYLQKYPVIESVLSLDSARIELGSLASWKFGRDYFYAGGGGGDPRGVIRAPVVIVTGSVTSETAKSLGVANKIVVFISPLNPRGAPEDFRSAFSLGGAGARAVILPGGRPDSLWRRLSADPDEHKPSASAAWPLWSESRPRADNAHGFRPILELWGGRWQQFVAASGIDTASLRSTTGTAKVTSIPQAGVLDFSRKIERVSWPANVVAVVPGSDPVLRNEYIVLTAHYDGLGMAKGRPPGPQSVLNGADDNASGVAVLMEVARTISAAPHPRRSIIFAAVSGEENGLWGSDFLSMRPPVPRSSIVANINMDMIGRPKGDTVYVTGTGNPKIGPIAVRAIRRISNRNLVILGDDALERRYPGEKADDRSDHASFRHRGIPPIALFTGWHDDYHETTDDVEKLDYAGLSRIAALVRDITIEIASK